ncbi:hypothetical protein THAOC_23361, partial [Thalassiosira oceanica]
MLGLRGRRPHPAAAMASIDNDLPGVSIEVPPPVPSARGVGASLSSRCDHLCLAIPIQGPKELRGTAAPKIPLNVNIDVENTSSITVVYRSWVLEIWPNVTTWVMSGARGDLYLGQPVYGCVEQDYEGLCDEANARNCFPQFVTLVGANQRRGHDSTARIINAMPRPTVDVTPKTTASSHLQKDQEGRIVKFGELRINSGLRSKNRFVKPPLGHSSASMLGLRGRRPHPAAAMASIDNDLPGVSIEVPRQYRQRVASGLLY